MSIEKVKEVLQKEKNRQIVLAGSNMQALTEGLNEVISRFAEDLNAEAAKDGVIKCLAAAGETINPTMAQVEYELAELIGEYDKQVLELKTELSAAISNAAALNEELTISFEDNHALEKKTSELNEQLLAVMNENVSLKSENVSLKDLAGTLTTEAEKVKLQAQTYKSQYEAAISAGENLNLDKPATQYDPPAPEKELPSSEPKNIYEAAAAMLQNMRGSR